MQDDLNNITTIILWLQAFPDVLGSWCPFNGPINSTIAQMDQEAAASKEQPITEHLNLKVKANDGEEIYFKIKKTTAFKKLMDTYCQRSNLNISNVRFLFEGQRITEGQTPKDLNMENNDEIDVVVEQFGG